MFDNEDALVVPEVQTLAKPQPKVLLAARFELQRNQDLRNLFVECTREMDDSTAEDVSNIVADFLKDKLEGSEADIQETARYLLDEYRQIGDSVLLISSKTGLPLYKVKEEDIWTPAPSARESFDPVTGESKGIVPGGESKPRLRPEIESFLVHWEFEREREDGLERELARKVFQSQALAEAGDPRLLSVTLEGRRNLVERLRADLVDILPKGLMGPSRRFADYFKFEEPSGLPYLKPFSGFTAYAKTRVLMMDQKSRNLRFDEMGTAKGVIANKWMQEMARTISQILHTEQEPKAQDFREYKPSGLLWVTAEPGVESIVSPNFFPVAGSKTFALKEGAGGFIHIRNQEVNHRLVHDRWEILGKIEYDLWLRLDAFEALEFTNLPAPVHYAEVCQ